MNKIFKKIAFLTLLIILSIPCFCYAEDSAPETYAGAAIIIHPKTDMVLYEKNAYAKMYPASTTKIMTAILALESGHDLSEKVTITNSAISSIIEGYSTAHLQEGEQITLEQLINVLLIPSANDAANVIAEFLGGSISGFAEIMNKKALELGCTSTHFTSPNGLHDEDHYTTAYDLAHIAAYAMKNETFRKIVAKPTYTLPATDIYPYDDRVFTNTNNLILKGDDYYYSYAIGIKTGFTTPAGSCLVAGCKKDDVELISVVLNTEGDERFSESIKILNYAFENYGYNKIASFGDTVSETVIENATKETKNLNLLLGQDIIAFSKNNMSKVLPEIKVKENLSAPIQKGEVVGSVKYTIDDDVYEAELLAGSNVEPDLFLVKLFGIILAVLIIVLVVILIISKNKKESSKYTKIDNLRF